MATCKYCSTPVVDAAQFCTNCGKKLADYPRPAGFWVRVGAQFIDVLIFLPIMVLSFVNVLEIKSSFLLVISSLPQMIYKPFMESRYGATLGKMAFKLKVIDEQGNKLNLQTAFIRFSPVILYAFIALIGQLIAFSSSDFQYITEFSEIAEMQEDNPLRIIEMIANLFLMVDYIFVAFTFRNRAIHDMLAKSYCVYKD